MANDYERDERGKLRMNGERRAVRKIVRDLLSAGYEISIDNGAEENELNNSRDENEIMRSLFACDEEVLIVRRVGEREDTPATRGFVRLVYGNSPEEVVCDYSMNLDAVVGGPR